MGNILDRFVWLTDTHIELDRWAPGEQAAGLAHINTLAPSFVIVTGDLVNDGADASNYDTYLAAMSVLTADVYNVPGNHDESAGAFVNYEAKLGPIHFTPFEFGPLYMISIVPHEAADLHSTISEAELAYLEAHLQLAGTKIPIVFCHYPVLSDFNPNINITTGGADLLALLDAYDVAAFFCGHGHFAADSVEQDGTVHIYGDAFVPAVGDTSSCGMMVCDLYKDRIEIIFRRGVDPWDLRRGPVPVRIPVWTTRAATRLHIIAARNE